MGIEPILHQMLQFALTEIQGSQVLETQAASRCDIATGQLKQLADLADKQYLSALPQKGESFQQVLQSALRDIQNGLSAMAKVQLAELADLAESQGQPVSPQKGAILQMLQLVLKEIQDSEVLETQAASRCDMATAQLKQLADLADKQYLSVSRQKGATFDQMLQLALGALAERQYATATGQLEQLADLADTMLAPAWDKLQARWTLTLQTRLRAALADPTVPADNCRALETRLHKCLQGKDFTGALKILDQLEPALKAAVFEGNRVKGETQKRLDQTRAYETMQNRFDIIGKAVFPKGESKRLLGRHPQATQKFRSFLDAMEAHENQRSEKSLKDLEALGRAFHSSDVKAEETQIVRSMMQWARFDGLRLEYLKIGPPLWDADKANRAGALTAAYLFEEGALNSRTGEDKTAKPLDDEKGASEAWWIRRLGGFFDEETVRQFIFKPVDSEPDFEQLPKGGGGIREVMAKAINDQVALMTGLDFGVCPTYLVGVSNERLPEASGRPDTTRGPVRTGAMQQLASNRGQIREWFNEGGPAFFKKIPTEEVHKVAILDVIILNFDRHGGNVLVDGYPPRMIPIDHGKSLPSREGFSAGKHQIEEQNYFLGHGAPQMDEPFSPEMLAIIDLIDPDQLVQGMKASRDALVKQHPDQKDKMGDESVEMARRSVLFLKKAAHHLTVRELMHAYTTVLEPVFDTPPAALEVAIDHAVRTAVDRKATGPQLDAYGRDNAMKELTALGWFTNNPNNPTATMHKEEQEKFLNEQGGRVLKILQGRIENPAVRRRFDELLREVGAENLTFNPNALPIQEALPRLKQAADERKKQDLEQFRPLAAKMGADLSALDEEQKTDAYYAAETLLADLKDFYEAGGDQLIPGEETTTPKKKLEAYGLKLMAKCAGEEESEAYYKRMHREFGGLVNRRSPAALARARYLQDCQEFESLGGKAKYLRLLGKPYTVNIGPQQAMVAMLKAESDASVDGVDLNAARQKAVAVGIQRLLAKTSAPRGQAGGLKRRIEQEMQVLAVNLDRGQYDAAEKILAELEAEVDRAVRGDNSDIAKLDRRIVDATGKVTKLQSSPDPSPELHAIGEALQAVEDLRKGWKLPQCETALGKLEKSVDTIAKKQAMLGDRRRYRDNSEIGVLESRLAGLYQKIQKVKKDPYLKGRYTEFSQRYWSAVKTKDEWNIGEATRLIDRIEREIGLVQPLVPQLDILQKRIDKTVEQVKDLPTRVLKDPTYRLDVAPLIEGARTWITEVGVVAGKPEGRHDFNDLVADVKKAHTSLDQFESKLAKVVAQYAEKQ